VNEWGVVAINDTVTVKNIGTEPVTQVLMGIPREYGDDLKYVASHDQYKNGVAVEKDASPSTSTVKAMFCSFKLRRVARISFGSLPSMNWRAMPVTCDLTPAPSSQEAPPAAFKPMWIFQAALEARVNVPLVFQNAYL
jgi:hypothetical protein